MALLQNIHYAFEQRLLPLAEKTANLPTLVAVRSSLVATLPFMLVGSFALVLNNFPLPAYREFMEQYFGPDWRMFGTVLFNGTFAIMSLLMLFTLGHQLAEQRNAKNPVFRVNPVVSGLVSFVSFFCLLPQETAMLSKHWLGVAGLFMAITVGLLSTKLFLFFFSFKRLHLHLPGGASDVTIPQVFNALIPGMLTVAVFGSVCVATRLLVDSSVYDIVYNLIRMPFDNLGDNIQRSVLYVAALHGLWFLGIHGANVLDPITHDVYGAAMAANEVAAAAGLPLPHVMTKTFLDTFVFMGGAGTSLCLIGALILFGKTPANRKLGLLSLAPGVFNINEVLMFGLPVVLNPLLLIPFLCTPLLLTATSYAVISLGLVPGTSAAAEWTTPVLLNGYISTESLLGPLLQVFNLGLGILIYAPFILIANKINAKQFHTSFRELLKRASATKDFSRRCVDYQDYAGSLARSLIIDLEYDHRRGKGLYLEYQPKVAARTGRVVGVEALIRWTHQPYGAIPAPIIVSLAEESNLIHSLGLWVFETACRTRRHWLDQGVGELSIAVNVSAMQLTKELPGQFREILHRYDLSPSLIEVEVTESQALDTSSSESRILGQLYDMGLPLAIDDFGMGHSSLKYLKQFPVSTIKIDGAITREVVTNPICADIVVSIIRLCRAQNMLSVAEFVENDAQVELLTTLGCDIFQGYKYSRSLVDEACLRFILDNHARTPCA